MFRRLIYTVALILILHYAHAAAPQFLDFQSNCINSNCYVDGNIYISITGEAKTTFSPDQDIDLELRLDSETGTLLYQRTGYFKQNVQVTVTFYSDRFDIQEGSYAPETVSYAFSQNVATQFVFIIKNASSEEATKNLSVTLDTSAPNPPTGVSVAPGDETATVRWTKSSSTDVKYYNVYYREEGTNDFNLAGNTVSENETSLSVSNLTNEVSYEFGVSAVDRVLNEGTMQVLDDNGQPVKATPSELVGLHGLSPDEQGGCFIATAVYGSPEAMEVRILKEFRDRFLKKSAAGRRFVRLYYKFSPSIAGLLQDNGLLRFSVRVLLFPVVFISFVSLDSPLSAFLLASSLVLLGLLAGSFSVSAGRKGN